MDSWRRLMAWFERRDEAREQAASRVIEESHAVTSAGRDAKKRLARLQVEIDTAIRHSRQ